LKTFYRIMVVMAVVLGLAVLSLAEDKVEAPDKCQKCGMNRTKFGHSRTLVEYTDGAAFGGCSIGCAFGDLEKNPGKSVKHLKVADYNTRVLIDAKSATWVIGGKKNGVMTKNPKWAFEQKKAAEDFIAENGGALANYDQVISAVKGEFEERRLKAAAKEKQKISTPAGGVKSQHTPDSPHPTDEKPQK